MATRGRKPNTEAVKELQGNPGKRAPKAAQKAQNSSAPPLEMPSDLTPAAQVEWKRVVPGLVQRGVVNGYDQTALADYCLCVQRLAECELQVSAMGLLIQGERGMVKNPALQLAREYRNSIRQWCSEFGLTPNSRGRMNLPPEDDKNDPFKDFLDGTDE